MSLEELNHFTGNEETILWNKLEVKNKLRPYYRLMILVVIIYSLLVSFIIVMITTSLLDPSEESYIGIIVSIIFSIIFFIIPTYIIIKELKKSKRIKRKLGLKTRDLKEFKEIYALTDKRWIQRSFFYFRKEVYNEAVEKNRMKDGFVSISLREISVVYVVHFRKSKYYYVNFFDTWDRWSEEAFFVVSLEENDYIRLKDALNRVFQFVKEERDVIRNGDIVYYCKIR